MELPSEERDRARKYSLWSSLITPWPPAVAERLYANWYYVLAGRVVGPVRIESLGRRLQVAPGAITHVWTAGMPEWSSPSEALSLLASIQEIKLARSAGFSLVFACASCVVVRPPGGFASGLALPLTLASVFHGIRGLKSSKRQYAVYGLVICSASVVWTLAVVLLLLFVRR